MTHSQRSQALNLKSLGLKPEAIAQAVGVPLEDVERVLEAERKHQENQRRYWQRGESSFEN